MGDMETSAIGKRVHGSSRRLGVIALMMSLAQGFPPTVGPAWAQVGSTAKLSGVVGVSFGKAQRYKDASGKEMCAIVQPLPHPPVFARGATEISYGVHLQPRAVKSASTQLVAPGQSELRREPCNVFTLIERGFSQTQLGSTVSRLDGKPMMPGKYTLRVTVDGRSLEIPFEIAR